MAEDAFARIQAAAKKVNTRADAITARISAIEARLESAGAGFDVEDNEWFHTELRSHTESNSDSKRAGIYLGLPPHESTGRTFMVEDRYSLVYTRVGAKFRIAYLIDSFEVGSQFQVSGSRQVDQDGPYPLGDADRQMRLRAEERLDPLVELIAEGVEDLAATKREAKKK